MSFSPRNAATTAEAAAKAVIKPMEATMESWRKVNKVHQQASLAAAYAMIRGSSAEDYVRARAREAAWAADEAAIAEFDAVQAWVASVEAADLAATATDAAEAAADYVYLRWRRGHLARHAARHAARAAARAADAKSRADFAADTADKARHYAAVATDAAAAAVAATTAWMAEVGVE